MLIGVGSRRRSAGQAIDLPNDRGVNLGRLFTAVPVGNSILLATDIESGDAPALWERSVAWLASVGAFRSRAAHQAENTILRHQLNVLRRRPPKRPTFGMLDRLITGIGAMGLLGW